MSEVSENPAALARELVDAADRVAALERAGSAHADALASTAATALYLAAAIIRGNAAPPTSEAVTLLRVAVDSVFCEATGLELVNEEDDVVESLRALLRDWSLTLRRDAPPTGTAATTSGRALLGEDGWKEFLGALAHFREETRRLRAAGGPGA